MGQQGKLSNDTSHWPKRRTASDFYCLKNPAWPLVAPGARYTVSCLNGSRGPGRQLARDRAAPIVLISAWPFLKRWGSLPKLHRSWFTCTVTFDESLLIILCPGSESPPSTHGVNPCVLVSLTLGLSVMSGSTCIAPNIAETLKPYHDDNLGTQSAGALIPYGHGIGDAYLLFSHLFISHDLISYLLSS